MKPRDFFHVLFLALLLLSVPAAAQEPTPQPGTYVVQPGDTLSAIAQRFGTTVEALAAANGIADPSLIVAGQKLVIPASAAGTAPEPAGPARERRHPVRRGETLPFLAFRYGTTTWALRELNDVDRHGLLWPGQELIVPPPITSTLTVPGFPAVTSRPAPVRQGQTMVVDVQGEAPMIVDGELDGRRLAFAEEGGRYWALAGIDALAAPGAYTLALTATETTSGDLITLRETVVITAGHFSTLNIVVPASRQNLLDPELDRAEAERVAQVFAGISARRLWGTPFALPLEGELRTTAQFGQRRSYSGGPVTTYHAGQDVGADAGTPVYAPAQGVVVLAEGLQVRGNAVILDHGLGVFTGFWHLSRIDVTVGQTVMRGEQIGLVGNTGLSTGPHLHWEMRVLGMPVDPMQWTREKLP